MLNIGLLKVLILLDFLRTLVVGGIFFDTSLLLLTLCLMLVILEFVVEAERTVLPLLHQFIL
tara:strand:+ start:167 stop:352 length:186 start_codon:yes stop_codon:yes gene_type:complete